MFVWPSEKKVVSLYMMNYLMSYFGVGLYSPRELSSMKKKELDRCIYLAVWYCRYTLGENSRRPIPKVKLVPVQTETCYYGQYDPTLNEIHVFTDEVHTLGMLTSVILHEYTHYLQPILSKYYKLLEVHGYDNHPFEIEARENERVHNRRILNYLRKNY